MTRNELTECLKELGIEEPAKALVTGLLTKFNEEKRNVIVETTNKIMEDVKDWKKPEEYQKVVDELNLEKGKGALAERKAKYKKANLNIEDEDILNLVESKLKESKDFDKDLDEYVKAHPSFIVSEGTNANDNNQQQIGTEVTLGALDNGKGKQESSFNQDFRAAFGIKQ